MSYLLATTETRVRWYQVDFNAKSAVLHEVLDLDVVTQFVTRRAPSRRRRGWVCEPGATSH